MDKGKLKELITIVTDRNPRLTKADVLEYVNADWGNKQDQHDQWLDTAPVTEIAGLLLSILD